MTQPADRFRSGDPALHATPPGSDDAPGYRSLRELSESAGDSTDPPVAGREPRRIEPVNDPAAPRHTRGTQWDPWSGQDPRSRTAEPAATLLAEPDLTKPRRAGARRRRQGGPRVVKRMVLGLVLVLVLGVAGYAGYRLAAPYFGFGYTVGGSATASNVHLTVVGARCGLDHVRGRSVPPESGQYCRVDVRAENTGRQAHYLDLASWQVRLDVGLDARPAAKVMAARDAMLAGNSVQTYHLFYDVPDGARMNRIDMSVGDTSAELELQS